MSPVRTSRMAVTDSLRDFTRLGVGRIRRPAARQAEGVPSSLRCDPDQAR